MHAYQLQNWLFYTIKPLIPRPVQLFARRQLTGVKRKLHTHIWPIDPASARPPEGWTGWPGGKQFAFVLSHDVDSLKGYNDVLKLADLEERMGFRSSFNFVPERYGRISLSLLDELGKRGFGVAVHGLKHDGKLFLNKRIFDRRSPLINAYLRQWGTRGFTSPSMHHNLEWLSALEIDYSTSTFDTDPFEPQPDAVGTIFPFWVADVAPGKGFVEIPYTLPQDSTLFIIMREKTIDIWKRKLDWVAAKGGMVLVNTHPDYMRFGGGEAAGPQYPVERYIELLEYVKSRYAGRFLHALPSKIADICRQRCLHPVFSTHGVVARDSRSSLKIPGIKSPQPHGLHVAMLSYSFYESDGRVRRYAETLVQRGDRVDVLALRREGQSGYGELNGVRVHRLQKRVRDEKGRWDHLGRIMKFFARSAAQLTQQHLDHAYDLVHVHSVPDFEVFAALVPKLLGAKVVLDIHDIVPELYGNKFNVKKASSAFKALVLMEKLSTRFSDHTIISNDLWKKTLLSRSVAPGKCTSILNYPDGHLFRRSVPDKQSGKIVLLYPGTLNRHQGLDIAISAFAKIRDAAPNAEFQIYGEGPARPGLEALVGELQLQGRVLIKDPVPLDEIVGVMAAADIGVIPKKDDDFGGEAFSTKTLEFMMLGVPIIVARTRIDRFYFNDSMVKFFEPGNADDLAAAMLAMINDQPLRDRLAAAGAAFAHQNRWDIKKEVYLNLVDGLCGKTNRT
jgi:glycosyltransferase involved in cell wall biosynthesis